MADSDIPTEALEAAALALAASICGGYPTTAAPETVKHARAAVAAAAPHLIAEGRRQAIEETERRGSRLCDCDDLDDQESPPTNPRTGARMDHHCDCLAVNTAAAMLGAYSATKHARECGHGTEMDHV